MTRGTVPFSRRPRSTSRVLAHPWWTVAVWAAFFAVLAPTALTYTHVVNYSGATSDLSGSESARAQALLATVRPSYSTLIVAVNTTGFTAADLQNITEAFAHAVSAAAIPYVNGTSSVYSAYASYLDAAFGPQVPDARALAGTVENLSGQVYGFPARFLAAWIADGLAPDWPTRRRS